MAASPDDYDFIVVGCGAAGLSAAVSYIEAAKEQKRAPRVAVLESAPKEQRGGATRWTTSRFRAREDYSLDPLFVGKVQEVSRGLSDIEYCRVLEREVPNTLRFLEAHSVKLLHYGPPVAMGVEHEVTPNGGGHAVVEALASSIEQSASAQILYQTEAVRLSLTEDGRVNGVVVRGEDGLLRTLRARAVVLACGGFEGNKEMLSRYLGPNACDLPLLAPGLAFNQGAGIRMAMEIGAGTSGQFDMIHSELVDRRTSRPDAYIYGHPFGIVVNEHGKRFYDEGQGTFEETFELIAFEVWRNQNQSAFFIADQTITGHKGIMVLFDTDKPPVEAGTLPELAAQLGLDPESLGQTIEEYNAAVGPGEFDPNRRDGKSTHGLTPEKSNWAYRIEKPPYFAYPLTSAICFTYGGIRTDRDARVVTANGVPLPGLYAAGEIVGLFYHEYPAGTSVLRSLTFGRIAGAHAAKSALANR
ncbi:MAG TPA: FAD-binding protein [Xanthobacteraceae bacterium]|nr:FAD-binding protein [Xanthobacteraceae bacterium]